VLPKINTCVAKKQHLKNVKSYKKIKARGKSSLLLK